jgi:hypothetical protein
VKYRISLTLQENYSILEAASMDTHNLFQLHSIERFSYDVNNAFPTKTDLLKWIIRKVMGADGFSDDFS